MKYYLIAGERSGDLHGGNLLRALGRMDVQSSCRGFGGDAMQEAGMELTLHYREMAFMGFFEIVQNLPAIRRNFRICREDLLAFAPDALILIDYAGFNLRMAAFAKKHGIPVIFYISPKIWAWNQGRGWKIKRRVDRMLCILPFEKEFYRKFAMEVAYVGNPVLDAINDYKKTQAGSAVKTGIALLPGSRLQEIRGVRDMMCTVAERFPEHTFYLACVNNISDAEYAPLLSLPNVQAFEGQTYDLLQQSRMAVVVSGTATLETALLKVPQVVVYRTNPVTYAIARRLIAVPFISLVNLVAGKEVVRELIQGEMHADQVEKEISRLLIPEEAGNMIREYNRIEEILSTGKPASENAAEEIVRFMT